MVHKIFLYAVFIFNITLTFAQPQYAFRDLKMHSEILGEQRRLIVMLPKEYKNTLSTYPTLYILDAESRLKEASEAVQFLMDNHFIPPVIMVGINNTDRFRDMTPVDSVLMKSLYPTRGHADTFLWVLRNEIIPFVNKNFRASSRRVLAGYDYSGNFVLNTFIKGNDIFDKYLCISPMLWWNGSSVLGDMQMFLKNNSIAGKYLFLSFGRNESPKMKADAHILERILSRNAAYAINWDCMWLPNQDHYTLYRESLTKGLEAIYKDYRYLTIQELVETGVEGAKEYERKILLNYGRKEVLPFSLLESVSIRLKQDKRYNDALLFLKYSAYCHPRKSEVYFYIGEIYEEMQNLELAIQFYEESAKREPDRWDYRQKVETVSKKIQDIKEKAQENSLSEKKDTIEH